MRELPPSTLNSCLNSKPEVATIACTGDNFSKRTLGKFSLVI